MNLDPWTMVHGSWQMKKNSWPMAFGCLPMRLMARGRCCLPMGSASWRRHRLIRKRQAAGAQPRAETPYRSACTLVANGRIRGYGRCSCATWTLHTFLICGGRQSRPRSTLHGAPQRLLQPHTIAAHRPMSIWLVARGPWLLAHGPCLIARGSWPLAHGLWPMTRSPLAHGSLLRQQPELLRYLCG